MRLCTSPMAEALKVQAHKINADRFEIINCKTGGFTFAASEAAARAMACDMGWVDFIIVPPQVAQ